MKLRIGIAVISVILCILLRNPWHMAAVLASVLIIIFLVDIIEKRKTENQIDDLISYITKVQDYSSLPEMQKISEGRMGILQSEIYKVITILLEQYSSEHDQKKYMSDMMSDISHQFKTPLTAISLMNELLMNETVGDEQRLEYTGKIDAQINKMTWLLKSLLTLSQLEAGVLEMKAEKAELNKLIKDLSEPLLIMAEVAEVEYICSIPDRIVLRLDIHWFKEALSNIIKNCIEHTNKGGFVRISASQNNLHTSIVIEDNGKGIEKEHLPHIFERFYKAGNSSHDSVGIGLAMARQIIRAHDGKIEVESEIGKGTKFTISLY
ncbi:HAMP domain-containing sensor histidine kinase [Ruminococcus sp.]|uniref:sensor histidine kinase n=1 Tax=Ruminococcus sp. TaxID=41978 RepID=UPI0025F1DC28|nr:HAMP domain-containing sensor histidine kinase [Ruminococcus sp.]